ncbi:MAG TPA: HEAT repeat domain-containing protein, partial [Pyrinomonadaceae bacterium]|nr:HEAT repeat domain-containing protein [Pyrinomonadaceae bacterium]
CPAKATLAIRCGAALLFGAALVTAQSRPAQSNSNKSGKRQHVTTLRSSDSPEGSRVAINSDQSLSDYEAYRRGDRFYVRIPAADVPRAEATRGRGFADVKVQRGSDSTVISFRLQPGATAHVEQRSNKLDVVFSAPGTVRVPPAGSNADRDVGRKNPASNSAKTPARPVSSPSPTARNAAANTGLAQGSERSGSKLGAASPPPRTIIASVATPAPFPTASPNATPAQKAAAKPTASPGMQPMPATTATSTETAATSWQSRMEERARYWILLAQINPIPVVIGAVMLALFVLFLLQRRRLKGTRRVRTSRSELKKAKTITGAAGVQASASRAEAIADVAAPATVAAAGVATSIQPAEEAEPVIQASAGQDSARQARVSHVAEQVKNVMAGEEYDPSLIGSEDRETRQLVGAELLSALVGRNLQRRDRARAAFMNHGYFDDATRDLRIADAPVERAAAARRLSFVHDREATPHLIAALDDSAPEVRRTAVEALMDLRDPTAIGPLNSLMQTETDRKVPRTLIKHAIDACATAAHAESLADVSAATPAPQLSATPIEPEREVIEL